MSFHEINCVQYVKDRLFQCCNQSNAHMLKSVCLILTLSLDNLRQVMTTDEIKRWVIILKYLRQQFLIENIQNSPLPAKYNMYTTEQVVDMCDAHW